VFDLTVGDIQGALAAYDAKKSWFEKKGFKKEPYTITKLREMLSWLPTNSDHKLDQYQSYRLCWKLLLCDWPENPSLVAETLQKLENKIDQPFYACLRAFYKIEHFTEATFKFISALKAEDHTSLRDSFSQQHLVRSHGEVINLLCKAEIATPEILQWVCELNQDDVEALLEVLKVLEHYKVLDIEFFPLLCQLDLGEDGATIAANANGSPVGNLPNLDCDQRQWKGREWKTQAKHQAVFNAFVQSIAPERIEASVKRLGHMINCFSEVRLRPTREERNPQLLSQERICKMLCDLIKFGCLNKDRYRLLQSDFVLNKNIAENVEVIEFFRKWIYEGYWVERLPNPSVGPKLYSIFTHHFETILLLNQHWDLRYEPGNAISADKIDSILKEHGNLLQQAWLGTKNESARTVSEFFTALKILHAAELLTAKNLDLVYAAGSANRPNLREVPVEQVRHQRAFEYLIDEHDLTDDFRKSDFIYRAKLIVCLSGHGLLNEDTQKMLRAHPIPGQLFAKIDGKSTPDVQRILEREELVEKAYMVAQLQRANNALQLPPDLWIKMLGPTSDIRPRTENGVGADGTAGDEATPDSATEISPATQYAKRFFQHHLERRPPVDDAARVGYQLRRGFKSDLTPSQILAQLGTLGGEDPDEADSPTDAPAPVGVAAIAAIGEAPNPLPAFRNDQCADGGRSASATFGSSSG
jgi:hypothetical protein